MIDEFAFMLFWTVESRVHLIVPSLGTAIPGVLTWLRPISHVPYLIGTKTAICSIFGCGTTGVFVKQISARSGRPRMLRHARP